MLLLLMVFVISFQAFAQRNVPMKNLWTRPQVHVLFEGYTISFTIKDINKALALLSETGDTAYGTNCGLDTAGEYYATLLPGTKQEYHNSLQPLLQNGVGAYLLSTGHAYIEGHKHKRIKAITMDMIPPVSDGKVAYVTFYDPATAVRIFTGKMDVAIYRKDIGEVW